MSDAEDLRDPNEDNDDYDDDDEVIEKCNGLLREYDELFGTDFRDEFVKITTSEADFRENKASFNYYKKTVLMFIIKAMNALLRPKENAALAESVNLLTKQLEQNTQAIAGMGMLIDERNGAVIENLNRHTDVVSASVASIKRDCASIKEYVRHGEPAPSKLGANALVSPSAGGRNDTRQRSYDEFMNGPRNRDDSGRKTGVRLLLI